MKNWLIAVGVVVGLGVVMFLSDRPIKGPGDTDILRSPNDYQNTMNQAKILALPILQKAQNGEEVSKADQDKLRQALKLFESMNNYEPRRVDTQFGAGRILMILGEKERAVEKLQQAVNDRDTDPNAKEPGVQQTVFEAEARLSELMLDLAAEEIANSNSFSQSGDKVGAEAAKKKSELYYQKALDYANAAVAAVPNSYLYLVDRGNVYLAVGKKDLAKKDFEAANALAPGDPRVKMAMKLIEP
ncbi:MAG: hypothetical protein JST12_02750 [Armatimonadetes bacterium]|nr:hypothetical protein [Armatimonadota bacterium]